MTKSSKSPHLRDLYSFDGFLADYCDRLERDTDSLVRNREHGCWPRAVWTYIRPAMVIKSDKYVVPKRNAKTIGVDSYVFLIDCTRDTVDVLNVTISTYRLNSPMSVDEQVEFRVVNEIRFLIGVADKLRGSQRLIPVAKTRKVARGSERVNGQLFEYVEPRPTKKGEPPVTYYLGAPGEFLLKYHWLQVSPDCLLTQSFPLPKPGNPAREGRPFPYSVVDQDYDLLDTDVDDVNSPGLREAVDFIGQSSDATLLRFLLDREIPILLSILRQDFDRLPDTYLAYLNSVTAKLRDIVRTFPDAVNLFAAAFFEGFRVGLAEDGKAGECQYCHNLFRFDSRYPNKKYCSRRIEGSDCGKRARNRSSYERHSDKRRNYYREEMRKTRARYHEVFSHSSSRHHPRPTETDHTDE